LLLAKAGCTAGAPGVRGAAGEVGSGCGLDRDPDDLRHMAGSA